MLPNRKNPGRTRELRAGDCAAHRASRNPNLRIVPYALVFSRVAARHDKQLIALLPKPDRRADGGSVSTKRGQRQVFLSLNLFRCVCHWSIVRLDPKIVGGRLRLNPLTVTLALLFWAWIWGAMRLILAVLIVGATKIICDYVDFQRGLGQWLGIDRLTIKLHSGHFPSPPLLGTPLMCYKPEHAQMDARTPEAP